MGVNNSNDLASLERLPGYAFRPYHGHGDHGAMAAVRLGCAQRDRIDARSIVEGIPTAAELAEGSAKLDDPSENQVLVEYGGGVVGYSTIRWWQERDGTWLYLHRGYLLPEHRGRGVGSTMLNWSESRIRFYRAAARNHTDGRVRRECPGFRTGCNGATARQGISACLQPGGVGADRPPATARRQAVAAGIRVGAVDPSSYRTVWKTVVDSYADAAFTERWTFESFLATAEPTCWRAAWEGDRVAAVALCSVRRHDPALGEVEELSVRAESRRRGLGRAVLLDGLRCLREHGAKTARLYTGTANPYRSYDLYESVGFRRQNEHVRYRKPVAV